MGKRFTDTDIWEQDWYIDLPNKYKLLFNYVKDKCDNAGIWRPNKSIIQKIVGEPINLPEFLQFINIDKERVQVLPSQRWFLRDFFVFQYGDKFSPTSNVHKGALKSLLQNGLHPREIMFGGIGKLQDIEIQELKEIAYSKDINILNEAYGNPIKRVKDKDKDKDKDIIPITENSNFEKIEEEMIVIEMMKVWNKHNPKSLFDIEKDYSACLDIAYNIAQVKGWNKSEVIKFKELQVLKSWEKIMVFVKSDNLFMNWPLKTLKNNFQMVVLKMSNNNNLDNNEKVIIPKIMTEEEKHRAMEDWANSD